MAADRHDAVPSGNNDDGGGGGDEDDEEFAATLAALQAMHNGRVATLRREVARLRREVATLRAQVDKETRRRRETRTVLDDIWATIVQYQHLISRLAGGEPVANILAEASTFTQYPPPKRRLSISEGGATFTAAADTTPVAAKERRAARPPQPSPTRHKPLAAACCDEDTQPPPPVAAAAAAIPTKRAAPTTIAFKDTPVRKKAEREKLPARECDRCKGVYDAVFGAGTAKAAEMRDECCRHREAHERPQTQPGFWDVDFPASETQAPQHQLLQQGQQEYTGAGIVPYATRPQDGAVVLLLHSSHVGNKRNMLVDFGGHAEPADANDPATTAARELHEETDGKVALSPEFVRRSVSVRNDRGYVLFFVPIDFRRELLGCRGAKGRAFVWVPVDKAIEGKTDLPLFERMTRCDGFLEALTALIE